MVSPCSLGPLVPPYLVSDAPPAQHGGNHGLNFLASTRSAKMLELADRRAARAGAAIAPIGDGVAQKLSYVLGPAWAAQAPGKRPTGGTGSARSCIHRVAARPAPDRLRFHGAFSSMNLLARSAAAMMPESHGRNRSFIRLGDIRASCGRLGEQPAIVGIDGGQPALAHKICRAAGEVDELAHHVGVDFAEELVEIQIKVFDIAAELRA